MASFTEQTIKLSSIKVVLRDSEEWYSRFHNQYFCYDTSSEIQFRIMFRNRYLIAILRGVELLFASRLRQKRLRSHFWQAVVVFDVNTYIFTLS